MDKIYKQTKEHRRRISEANENYGFPNSPPIENKISKSISKMWREGRVTDRQRQNLFKKGFDSRRIDTQFKIGHTFSNKTREKMKASHIGRNYQEIFGEEKAKEIKKKISKANEGKHRISEDVKKRMSITQKGKHYSPLTEFKKGEHALDKSFNWRGGKSFEPYGIEFNKELKEKVRKKYNYRCQECFRHQDELRTKTNRKYKLMIHHIDYNKENNKEKNLIPLCRECHNKTNWNRDDWTNHFQQGILK